MVKVLQKLKRQMESKNFFKSKRPRFWPHHPQGKSTTLFSWLPPHISISLDSYYIIGFIVALVMGKINFVQFLQLPFPLVTDTRVNCPFRCFTWKKLIFNLLSILEKVWVMHHYNKHTHNCIYRNFLFLFSQNLYRWRRKTTQFDTVLQSVSN